MQKKVTNLYLVPEAYETPFHIIDFSSFLLSSFPYGPIKSKALEVTDMMEVKE